jgi:hypothetical protein
MKKLAFAMLLLGGTALAQEKAKPMMMAPADLKWAAVPNSTVQIATVSGDFAKGPHKVFAKFPPKENHPVHSHSATLTVVVISGDFQFGAKGEKSKSYGPGSVVVVPGGFEHTSGSEAGCVVYQEGDGAFDMKMSEAPGAKKPAAKK